MRLANEGAKRQVDAAPCEVIVAMFTFGGVRCGDDALYTVIDALGAERRVCDEHLSGGSA